MPFSVTHERFPKSLRFDFPHEHQLARIDARPMVIALRNLDSEAEALAGLIE